MAHGHSTLDNALGASIYEACHGPAQRANERKYSCSSDRAWAGLSFTQTLGRANCLSFSCAEIEVCCREKKYLRFWVRLTPCGAVYSIP